MSSIIRSMARGIAKTNMKKQGMVHICDQKKKWDGRTWFASNWRFYVVNRKGAKV